MSLLTLFAGAGGGGPAPVTGTLAIAAQPATLSLQAQNTPPPNTATLGVAAQSASLTFQATVSSPPVTATVAVVAASATLGFSGNVAGVVSGTLGLAAQPASLSLSAQSFSGTLGIAAGSASLAFAVSVIGGVPLATDLIEAIVRFGRMDGELRAAFPDKSPSNRAFIFGQSNPDPPVPRCVVTVVSDTPPLENTGRGVVYNTLIQFSIFAGNTAQSKSLARLVRNKFRRQPLSFQDGYWIWAEPHVPRPMPPEQGPGTSFIYQTVVEVMYTVGNAYGPSAA